jgi:hypothetical protein
MATYYWVGGAGTWDDTLTANWSATSGGAAGAGPPNNADTAIFDGNSGSGTVSVAATAVSLSTTINNAGITLSLTANVTLCTSAGVFTLTTGALALNTYVLTCGRFSSTNSNTRSIAFGTGSIELTGNNVTVWTTATITNFTYTGTPNVRATYSGAVGTRIISSTGTEAQVLNFSIAAGADTLQITAGGGSAYGTVDYTGFSGTATSNTASNLNIFRDLIVSSTCTYSVIAQTTFAATSGTQKLTSNGKTFDLNIIKNGAASLQLQDNLSLAATRTFTLTAGTLDLFNKTLTATTFSTSNSNVRAIAFGASSVLTLDGSGTAFNAATGTNLTTSGSGTISLTSSSAKTFAGGGRSYPTLNQGGSGALTITGSNTFANITNSVQPATITLTSGTTQTITAFTASGTSGNLITLNASTAGSRATLTDSNGVNSVSYMDIKDIAATGYGEWQAYTSDGNVDSGNNVGWVFAEPPPLTASEYQISLKSFTERRSF